MSRKHIKVEPARWYYHCDRLGLLVWQDMVNAGSDQNLLGDDEWVKKNFLSECDHIVSNLKNHPCIVTWIAFNEGSDSMRIIVTIPAMPITGSKL